MSVFVSHTVAALVLLPLAASIVGKDSPHLQMILVGCSLVISGPMILTFASFPNMVTYSVEDDEKKPYVSAKDFLIYGGLVTITNFIMINTVFYGTALAMKW